MISTLFAAALVTAPPSGSHDIAAKRAAWNTPQAPFVVVGNIYDVGVAGLASFLIHTNAGEILIDGGLPESAPIIARNIAALGFDVKNVKLLLNTHAHGDHCGGLAELQRRSGASMVASAGDQKSLEKGSTSDFEFAPVHVDRVVADGERVTLGDTSLVAHLTPGHTPGCTTWTMRTLDHARALDVIFYCSTSVVDTLDAQRIRDYRATFTKLEAMHADVFLGPHQEFFHAKDKLARRAAGDANAFIDPSELAAFVATSKRDFEAEVSHAPN